MCAGMATIYDQQHVGLVRLAQWRSTLDATVNLSNIHTLIPHLLRKTSSFAYLVTDASSQFRQYSVLKQLLIFYTEC
ncbi:hypothetical protein CY34DRAFT_797636 [Suillus luteus UH-Slu-Lm8-n1]|uniref:Uncharacterized protein n=1 Tax=Suillus luteus UH-Slu-Lm8-n1 TaxID=930992 RepID=A0A0D0B441_9AGAM|nr:hypothetical protein CY34DRAFT_797636 [Suillus luteus UH-Slu-Lm8-n1]